MSEPSTPPLGAVLGPVPLWAGAAVVGALVGEQVGEHAGAATGRAGLGAVVASLLLLVGLVRRARAARAGADAGDGDGAGAATAWRPMPVGVGLLAAVAVAAATLGGAALRIDTTTDGVLPRLAAVGGQAAITATVVAEPRPIATGWHVLLRVDEVDGTATRERAAVTLDDDPPALGSTWTARAWARPLPEGGYGRWLARQHAVVALDLETLEHAGDPGVLAAASESVRDRVRRAATHHLDERRGGLLVGFVTGDTRLLPEDDQDAMRATGLTHLTAVSGSNVAIVIAGVLGVAALVRAGARARLAAVALTVPWFAFVTRFEPSVMRAGTMTGLLLLASARGVARDARHALAGAVLVLLLVDPRLAGSLGLLLSATATGGVLIVAPVVRARLPDRLPRRVAELCSITVGAQIAVVPVLLLTFGELGLSSVPANLVAVPAAALGATLAFLGTVLAVVHVGLGGLLFAVAGPAAGVVLASAHGFADVGGVVEVARPLTVVALLAACAWLLAGRGSRIARACAVVVVVALVAANVPAVTGRLPSSEFTLTAIDVGQGDAFLLESPGARMLVDAGGDDTAARWLRRNGRTHLDLVVVSHPHLDHVGGVPEVLRRLTVGAVWAAPLPTELPEAAEVFTVAAERDVAVRAPVAGDAARVGDLRIEVLHPPPGRPYRFASSELNESSYVLLVHHGGRRVLFTGDVEREGQHDLLTGVRDRLRADVLTVPHHGSRTTDPAFLEAIGGRTGVISAGRDNRHGHPHDETLAALQALDVEVRRTDLEGTVTVVVPVPEPASGPAALGADVHGLRRAGGAARGPPVGSGHGTRGARDRRRRSAAAA